MRPKFVQTFTFQWSVRDHALRFRSIDNFPRLADPIVGRQFFAKELREFAAEAGFRQIEGSTHTGTARFPRQDFARELVLATPLAKRFAAATAHAREAILADVTDAVSACEGDAHELRHPLTTNVLTAVAPDPIARPHANRIDSRPQARPQLLGGAR